MKKISSTVSGMISDQPAWARCWLSYSPAQSMVYPGGSFTCCVTFLMASSTVLPRSRPRTPYLIAT